MAGQRAPVLYFACTLRELIATRAENPWDQRKNEPRFSLIG